MEKKYYRRGLRTARTEALKKWAAYKKVNPTGLSRKRFLRTEYPELMGSSPSYAKRGGE